MPLTGAVVRDALAAVGAVGRQLRSFDELAAGASSALRQAPANLTPAGAAAFLATCAVEAAYFRTTVEYGTTLRYDPFRGRTFIQLTWEDNYRAFGRWCHGRGLVADPEVFVRSPVSLGSYEFAWLGAVFYFQAHNLWRWANVGDFRAVSQAVNGGIGRVGTAFVPNGQAHRDAMYGVFLRAGPALLPDRPEEDAVTLNQTQDDRLRLLTEQLVIGPNPMSWGWDAWPGGSVRADGTPDRFTPVDYLRKANQRTEDVMRELAALRAEVAAFRAAQPGQALAGALTADDVRQILREALADAGPLYLTTKETP